MAGNFFYQQLVQGAKDIGASEKPIEFEKAFKPIKDAIDGIILDADELVEARNAENQLIKLNWETTAETVYDQSTAMGQNYYDIVYAEIAQLWDKKVKAIKKSRRKKTRKEGKLEEAKINQELNQLNTMVKNHNETFVTWAENSDLMSSSMSTQDKQRQTDMVQGKGLILSKDGQGNYIFQWDLGEGEVQVVGADGFTLKTDEIVNQLNTENKEQDIEKIMSNWDVMEQLYFEGEYDKETGFKKDDGEGAYKFPTEQFEHLLTSKGVNKDLFWADHNLIPSDLGSIEYEIQSIEELIAKGDDKSLKEAQQRLLNIGYSIGSSHKDADGYEIPDIGEDDGGWGKDSKLAFENLKKDFTLISEEYKKGFAEHHLQGDQEYFFTYDEENEIQSINSTHEESWDNSNLLTALSFETYEDYIAAVNPGISSKPLSETQWNTYKERFGDNGDIGSLYDEENFGNYGTEEFVPDMYTLDRFNDMSIMDFGEEDYNTLIETSFTIGENDQEFSFEEARESADVTILKRDTPSEKDQALYDFVGGEIFKKHVGQHPDISTFLGHQYKTHQDIAVALENIDPNNIMFEPGPEDENNWYDVMSENDKNMVVEAITDYSNPFFNKDISREVALDYIERKAYESYQKGAEKYDKDRKLNTNSNNSNRNRTTYPVSYSSTNIPRSQFNILVGDMKGKNAIIQTPNGHTYAYDPDKDQYRYVAEGTDPTAMTGPLVTNAFILQNAEGWQHGFRVDEFHSGVVSEISYEETDEVEEVSIEDKIANENFLGAIESENKSANPFWDKSEGTSQQILNDNMPEFLSAAGFQWKQEGMGNWCWLAGPNGETITGVDWGSLGAPNDYDYVTFNTNENKATAIGSVSRLDALYRDLAAGDWGKGFYSAKSGDVADDLIDQYSPK